MCGAEASATLEGLRAKSVPIISSLVREIQKQQRDLKRMLVASACLYLLQESFKHVRISFI